MALLQDVAIIGAGLGGCALALALSEKQIPVRIYESRAPDASVIPSGVILTPNGLRVLDRLGILPRIKGRCYIPTHRIVKNRKDETTKKVAVDNASYGYDNHRIWRSDLLNEMKKMLNERSIAVHYGSKFNGIVSDDSSKGVTFRINDKQEHASLLVGSDGINSSVRKYLAPDVALEYTGLMGIIAHIKYSSVEWPYEGYEHNATIQDDPGAMIWMAEDPAGEDLMIALQTQHPQMSREEAENLQADKDRLLGFYRRRYDEWAPTGRKIIDAVTANKQTLYGWPFMKMPKLPRWYSETGRIILVGDGAHAMPPASGQGVNQALEDMYSLTLLLTSPKGEAQTLDTLKHWQEKRQVRIDQVLDWMNNNVNVERLGDEERKRLIAEGKLPAKDPKSSPWDDMSWLFGLSIEEQFAPWLDQTESS